MAVSATRSLVDQSEGRHCPLLWRLLVYWSAVASSSTNDRDDQIPTDEALAACPASKAVALQCVSCRPCTLQDATRIMQERGLRVRLPLQELQLLLRDEEEE